MSGYSWDQREGEDADRAWVGDASWTLWVVRRGPWTSPENPPSLQFHPGSTCSQNGNNQPLLQEVFLDAILTSTHPPIGWVSHFSVIKLFH